MSSRLPCLLECGITKTRDRLLQCDNQPASSHKIKRGSASVATETCSDCCRRWPEAVRPARLSAKNKKRKRWVFATESRVGASTIQLESKAPQVWSFLSIMHEPTLVEERLVCLAEPSIVFCIISVSKYLAKCRKNCQRCHDSQRSNFDTRHLPKKSKNTHYQ